MSQTVVGLFVNAREAEAVIVDLEAGKFPSNGIRLLREPIDMPVTGIMSTPSSDFEVGLQRDLRAMGASVGEANAYAQGVRRGGVLVFASGSDLEAGKAIEIMDEHGAAVVREMARGDADLPGGGSMSTAPAPDDSSQTGRIRQGGDGARMFVW